MDSETVRGGAARARPCHVMMRAGWSVVCGHVEQGVQHAAAVVHG